MRAARARGQAWWSVGLLAAGLLTTVAAPLPGQAQSLDASASTAELIRALEDGVTDADAEAALDTLRERSAREARPVVEAYARHRRPATRRRALRALARMGPPSIPVVVDALADSDERVRAVAARALVELEARSAVPELLLALERGVWPAAAAIGALGDDESEAAFSAHLGQRPMGVMLAGYDAYFGRSDIREATKRRIVDRLGEVASPLARRFLLRVGSRLVARRDAELRRHVEATARRIRATPR